MTTITRTTPTLHAVYAHRILLGLYSDLRAGRSETGEPYVFTNEELADWFTPELYADAARFPGANWLDQLGQVWNLAYNPLRAPFIAIPLERCRLQADTVWTITSALESDLVRRAVSSEHIDAHLTDELSAKAKELPPAEWLHAAGAAWAQALDDDARADALDY